MRNEIRRDICSKVTVPQSHFKKLLSHSNYHCQGWKSEIGLRKCSEFKDDWVQFPFFSFAFILFCFVLFYIVLFHFILLYFVLFCFILPMWIDFLKIVIFLLPAHIYSESWSWYSHGFTHTQNLTWGTILKGFCCYQNQICHCRLKSQCSSSHPRCTFFYVWFWGYFM